MKPLYMLVLAGLLMISGCASTRIVDDISLIQAEAFDQGEEKELIGNYMVPTYTSEGTTESVVYTGTSNTARGIRMELNGKAPKPLVSGQLRVVLFGEELAKSGVIGLTDVISRDATIGTRMFLAVVEGQAGDLLKQHIKVSEHTAIYISNLLEQNIRDENLPRTNFHEFLNDYHAEGKDPFLPWLQKQKDHVILDGIAILKDDKMVGTLDAKQSFIFKLLSRKNYKDGSYSLKVARGEDKEEFAVLENVASTTNYIFSKQSPPSLTIKVKSTAIIKEYTGKKGIEGNRAVIKQIQEAMENEIIKESAQMFAIFKENGVDPLGFGQYYKSINRDWDEKEWDEQYPQLTIKVEPDVKITESGITE